MTLSERRARILELIIEDYVQWAQPVGSAALVKRHALPLSSATVRNEMAVLEEEGLVSHPHTSAGRIPSNLGYQFYVRSLMGERDLSAQERATILHQFHQSARELEQWLGLAVSVLSNSVHNVALATEPRVQRVTLKRLQLVELTEHRALLVVVTGDAAVHQHALEFELGTSQEELAGLASRLNAGLSGKTAREIEASDEDASGMTALVLEGVADLLRREEGHSKVPHVEGVRELLRQPEYENSDRILDTLEAVEARALSRAVPGSIDVGDVAVVIGDENAEGPYQDMSFVLTRYGLRGGIGGMVGVLGPTRLAYGDAVAHVRYVGELLTDLIAAFYGEE